MFPFDGPLGLHNLMQDGTQVENVIGALNN